MIPRCPSILRRKCTRLSSVQSLCMEQTAGQLPRSTNKQAMPWKCECFAGRSALPASTTSAMNVSARSWDWHRSQKRCAKDDRDGTAMSFEAASIWWLRPQGQRPCGGPNKHWLDGLKEEGSRGSIEGIFRTVVCLPHVGEWHALNLRTLHQRGTNARKKIYQIFPNLVYDDYNQRG